MGGNNNGANLWADRSVKFLDPCTKSGVFLREITSRLTNGLAAEIPNLEERVDHILTKQVFGIGITHLTSLLARRGSIVRNTQMASTPLPRLLQVTRAISGSSAQSTHGKTADVSIGANQGSYDRGEALETHAYAFIHTDDIKVRIAELFGGNMQFDVIIGNPPYQLGSDGGTRDVPIYQRFVEQAKMLQPRFLAMVIPSRWMASGLGLGEFRQAMLGDRRIRELVDYPAASDVFPGVEVKAGVCYFLWDAAHDGDFLVTTIRGGDVVGPITRKLGEYDVFVRDARAVSILQKVLARGEPPVNSILARDKEFGWTSNFDGFHTRERAGDLPLYYIRRMKRDVGYIARREVSKSDHLIDTCKVLVPQAFNGGDGLPHQVVGKPLIAPNPSVCTQSFLFFYVDTLKAAKSIQSYYTTRFFRFLVSLRKITQHATHSTYAWVPMQTWNQTWTDEHLYAKYGITRKEQEYIESQVREMNLDDGDNE